MTLIEEKTLADHDINVRSIRQELQLLEEQLHGRNEPQPSPSVTDEDAVSRKAAIKAIRDTYRVSYPIDMISKDDAADVLTELPSVTLTITADTDTISRQDAIEHLKKRLYESALNNEGVVSETMEEIADNRIQIWMDELPPSPQRP